jgi:hypothetical protein
VAVRVRIKLKEPKSGRSLITVAIANAGFETDSLEIVFPIPLARALGFSIKRARKEVYWTAGGLATMYKIPNPIEVQIVTKDRESDPVKCSASISKIEDEVILSDKLISEFKIVLEDVGKGLWRFRDESVTKLRKSEKTKRW